MNERVLENPISQMVLETIKSGKHRLHIAVPFLSSFASSLLDSNLLDQITDKKLLTRFDETNINSFDLPTLKYLLECGFQIRFDNRIHLKLYIAGHEAFISSSNLTQGGFQNNIELTVLLDHANVTICDALFNKLWKQAEANTISKKLLAENAAKYMVLKKRQPAAEPKPPVTPISYNRTGDLRVPSLIKEFLKMSDGYASELELYQKANTLREKTKTELLRGFRSEVFYVAQGHSRRRRNLCYNFVYGDEYRLAGTGLRESQYKAAFLHPDFSDVISFVFPEMIKMPPWNLGDRAAYYQFCTGLFDFNLPQYSETIPIRLASFFYPEHFIPVFKLDHLQRICTSLGYESAAKTSGERLYAYDSYLLDKLRTIPISNYGKADLCYHLMYTIEMYDRLKKGETLESIRLSHKKMWKRRIVERGVIALKNTGALK